MLRLLKNDTIFALSSAPGKAGIAVIRISGPDVFKTTAKNILSRPLCQKSLTFKTPVLRAIVDPKNKKEIIDPSALILNFPKNNSFTGEDTLELHLHGGKSIVNDTLKCLGRLENHRMAERGEFSQRAFMNGRIKDLTQCEALVNLIESETRVQRLVSAGNFNGRISSKVETWSNQLLKLLALCEADLDFGKNSGGDTQIKEDLFLDQVEPKIQNLISEIKYLLSTSSIISSRLTNGLKICILGRPNVGKSSLINLISDANLAIVTDVAGTTRDILSVNLDIGGYPVIIYDTAGIRRPVDVNLNDDRKIDKIEQIGIEKAKNMVLECDLCLMVEAVGTDDNPDDNPDDLIKIIPNDKPILKILNKIDLLKSDEPTNLEKYSNHIKISCKNKDQNFKNFLSSLELTIEKLFSINNYNDSNECLNN